jgi:hypothetical protein
VNETLELFHYRHGSVRRAYAQFVADGIDADSPFDVMPRPGFLLENAWSLAVVRVPV